MNPLSEKKRIAVLGGGISALSTVFELTSDPGWQDHFDITVYQQGHRLGGKCASARAVNGDVERIEEHGLHVFFGFYDNAFDLMRRTYAELGELEHEPSETRLTFAQAFLPRDLVLLGDERYTPLRSWTLPFPRRASEPGRPTEGGDELTPGAILSSLLELVVGQVLFLSDRRVSGLGAPTDGGVNELKELLGSVTASRRGDLVSALLKALAKFSWILRAPLSADALVQALRVAQKLMHALDSLDVVQLALVRRPIAFLLARLRTAARLSLDLVESPSFAFSQLTTTVDLILTISIGLLRDDLLSGHTDWFALDDIEYRDWLRKHGARAETCESPALATLADATFSDSRYHGSGAGTTVHLTLRMLLHYKQAILFKFAAGMGETVIAPLYRVLSARGVKFEFFHRVEQLLPGSDGETALVKSIAIRRQATVIDAADGYQPLRPFADGMLCFPSRPDFDQLVEGADIRDGQHDLESAWNAWDPHRELLTLEVGRDYDFVVLGISIGALRIALATRPSSRSPLSRKPRWGCRASVVTTC